MNEGHLFCDSPEWRATVRDEVIPWAVGQVDLGDDVLEVGPGYGATTDVFAGLLPRLTSVEIDEELAGRLRTRYAGTHVEVVQGDATRLTFPDGRFSGAVCFSMLHHVPSAEAQDLLFADVARVLRAGAALVAVDGIESEGVRDFHAGDTYVPVDPPTLPDRLRRAGFGDVEVRTGDWGWTALARRAVVTAWRDIAAPAGVIFELIADPAQQPLWDGNDNLAEAGAGQRVRGVGDVFTTTLTKGSVRDNHVVAFVEGRRLAWKPAGSGQAPPGHVWAWDLEPLGPGRTRVTHTYDWTMLTDSSRLPRARSTTPEKLRASIDRLAALAEAT